MSISRKKIGVPFGIHPNVGGVHEYQKFMLGLLMELSQEHNFDVVLMPTTLDNLQAVLPYEDSRLTLGGSKVSVLQQKPSNQAELDPESYISQKPEDRQGIQLARVNIDPDLHRRFKKAGVDALFCLSPGLTGPLSGIPYIAPVFDLMHKKFNYPEVTANNEKTYRDFSYINMFLTADFIIAESVKGIEDILRYYSEYITSDKIKVVEMLPNDYQNKRCSEVTMPELPLRNLFGVKYFFYPAQYWEHKHHDTLIWATRKLRDASNLDFKLIFSGSYADYNRATNFLRLKAIVRDLGLSEIVKFIGFVSRESVDFLYRNALCTLMPSSFGPSNLPPLEALIRGCPVVVSDAYGMEDFLPFGVNKIPSRDIDGWANVMAEYLLMPQKRAQAFAEQYQNLEIRSREKSKQQVLEVLDSLFMRNKH
jgi:glycosyltransferase involved in cell wall biosynthesis